MKLRSHSLPVVGVLMLTLNVAAQEAAAPRPKRRLRESGVHRQPGSCGVNLEWWRSSAAGPLYYEPARDSLLKVGGDRVLRTSTALLRRHGRRRGGDLSYGVGHTLTYVFDAPGNRSQRIGVIAVRQFGWRRFGLHSPRLAGQVSYYFSDPSRKGQFAASLGPSIGLIQ